jgi:hypothetical protein
MDDLLDPEPRRAWWYQRGRSRLKLVPLRRTDKYRPDCLNYHLALHTKPFSSYVEQFPEPNWRRSLPLMAASVNRGLQPSGHFYYGLAMGFRWYAASSSLGALLQGV